MTKVATKKKFPNKSLVYLNEYNLVHDNSAYLPLVSGCLHAHALTFPAIRDSYEFAPYSFKTDLPDNILSEIKTPEVVAFSLYTWSTNLSLHVAREIKLRNPNSLIIFGGGSVPHDPTQFMTDYPFIDICVRGEGELPFSDILMRNISSREFSNIPQISWRNADKIEINSGEHPFERDLDKLPSPYIEGLFDQLIKENPQFNFQAILETNRGCPFKCTFCYWGKGGIGRRFKFHSLERVKQDIEWIGKNNIGYVFGADSNFGMHRRDIEIAQAIADVKKRYGSPQRFRVCYGKNTDENIYKAGKLLFDHGLDKGVNLSRQSNSKEVLANIKRGNIKMDTYRTLQTKFAKSGIPTWTELILGLPGETYDSFVEGVEDVLNSELKALFIYWLEALPNTDMADPDYQTKYGIKLKTTDIQPIHCAVASDGGIIESVPMVVETASMPHDQWRRTWKFSWLMLTFQSLGACSFISHFLRSVLDVPYTDFIRFLVDEASNVMPDSMIASEIGFYEKQLDLIYDGKGWGVEIEGYELYWFMEECSFLRIAEDKDRFFKDLEKLLNRFLDVRKITFDPVLISEVVRYQWLRMPSASLPPIQQWKFHYNIPEFMESVMTDECVEIREQSQILSTKVIDYKSDKNDFASKRVLFGRKNDDVLWSVNWFSGDAAPIDLV
jgi:radical SAM superfamily enzyme YgiQ (UPF0313 family)